MIAFKDIFNKESIDEKLFVCNKNYPGKKDISSACYNSSFKTIFKDLKCNQTK